MKDYYAILKIRRFASSAEVRRAYRVLVQKYHPDVNPDPSAATIIREVNEAYEMLGDEQKKREYDDRLVTPVQQTIQPQRQSQPYRDPRYRNPFKPSVKKDSQQLELMKQYIHLAVNVSWAGCALCLFLSLDILLPSKVELDTIRSLFSHASGRASTNGFVTETGRTIKVSDDDVFKLGRGMSIEITKTRITSITTSLYLPEKQHRITSLATLYRNYVFIPILLLITSVLGLLIKEQIEMKFNLGIVSFLLLIFTIILILK